MGRKRKQMVTALSTQGLSITMADRNYTVSGEEALVHLQVKPSPLNLVLDIGIPGRLNLTLVWNKHMSVSIKIRHATQVLTACLPVNHGSTWSQGEGSTMKPVWFPSNFLPQDALCGLCGNSNGNMKDDFETRSKYVASNELEFVNSWKESPLCGDASYVVDPCSLNTFRRPWAERKCNIINSQTFAACHSKVGPVLQDGDIRHSPTMGLKLAGGIRCGEGNTHHLRPGPSTS